MVLSHPWSAQAEPSRARGPRAAAGPNQPSHLPLVFGDLYAPSPLCPLATAAALALLSHPDQARAEALPALPPRHHCRLAPAAPPPSDLQLATAIDHCCPVVATIEKLARAPPFGACGLGYRRPPFWKPSVASRLAHHLPCAGHTQLSPVPPPPNPLHVGPTSKSSHSRVGVGCSTMPPAASRHQPMRIPTSPHRQHPPLAG